VTSDTKYIVELKQSGNVWAVASTKSEAYTPVADAPKPAAGGGELTQTAHAATLPAVARPVAAPVPAPVAATPVATTARLATPAPASAALAPAAKPFSIPIGKRDVVIVPAKTVAAATTPEKKHVAPSFLLSQPSPAVGRPKEQPVILSQPSTASAPVPGTTAANRQTKVSPNTPPQKVAVKPQAEKKQEPVAAKPAPTASAKAIAHGEISTNLSANAVRLRSTPSTSGAQITEMPRGTAVEILSKENGWYKVRSGGKEGYVFAGLVDCKREQAYTTAVVTKSKHITNSSGRRRVGAPAIGDRVIVLGGIKNNKYKVQLPNGRTGYVDKDAVDVAVEAPEFVH
jgi:uncharacterized protein YgiM (DUF1202 family)